MELDAVAVSSQDEVQQLSAEIKRLKRSLVEAETEIAASNWEEGPAVKQVRVAEDLEADEERANSPTLSPSPTSSPLINHLESFQQRLQALFDAAM